MDQNYEEQMTNEPAQKRLLVSSIMRQIKNGVPMSRVQMPIAFVEARSLAERYSDYFSHIGLAISANGIPSPDQRFLQMLKFYLSGWHLLFKEVRHPFNPILGEVFKCSYQHDDSTSEFIAEQVSHHPAATAFSLYNRQKAFAWNAYVRPSFHFSLRRNCAESRLEGLMKGYLIGINEEYEATMPSAVVKGIILGELSIDLDGKSQMRCARTGFQADIEFKTRGVIRGGQDHSLVAQVRQGSNVLYTIQGFWNGRMEITNTQTGQTSDFMDVTMLSTGQKLVLPVAQQAENESQRVWKRVTDYVVAHNEDAAQSVKTEIENAQRERVRLHGEGYVSRLFIPVTADYMISKDLAALNLR